MSERAEKAFEAMTPLGEYKRACEEFYKASRLLNDLALPALQFALAEYFKDRPHVEKISYNQNNEWDKSGTFLCIDRDYPLVNGINPETDDVDEKTMDGYNSDDWSKLTEILNEFGDNTLTELFGNGDSTITFFRDGSYKVS